MVSVFVQPLIRGDTFFIDDQTKSIQVPSPFVNDSCDEITLQGWRFFLEGGGKWLVRENACCPFQEEAPIPFVL